MVINDKYKFVFVHIPKTAGSSITHLLSSLPGNNKSLLAKTKHETLQEFDSMYERRCLEAHKKLSAEVVSYFRFGFVRNPWSRMFSLYRYLKEVRPRKEIDRINDFKHFLLLFEAGEQWINGLHSTRSQIDFLMDCNGSINVDFLGHFEFLEEDFCCVADYLKFPQDLSIPKLNITSSSVENYIHHYDDKMIQIVQGRFSSEIKIFGYSFHKSFPSNRCSRAIRP